MITLSTLPYASEQDVFDQVAAHLLRQNERSTASWPNNACRYRGDHGKRCAAGCLIGEGEYSADMEGKSWDDLLMDNVVPKAHSMLIDDLQEVHDQTPPEDWAHVLRTIAETYALDEDSVDMWEAKNL